MSKYVIDSSTLTSIADAVRTKGGTTDPIVVSDIPTAITNLPSGGGGDLPSEITIPNTTNGRRAIAFNYDNNVNWLIDLKIPLKFFVYDPGFKFADSCDLVDASHLTFIICGGGIWGSFYNGTSYMIKMPNIYFSKQGEYHLNSHFNNCSRLRKIPVDYFYVKNENGVADFNTTILSSSADYNLSGLFGGSNSLRNIPILPFDIPDNKTPFFNFMFSNCSALDKVEDFLVPLNIKSSNNNFNNIFLNCFRLNNFTFKNNSDGTTYLVNWKSQVIDLTSYVGYASSKNNILNYNSGITADKEVTDDASYQLLKNDPDWFTCDVNYSRYNHDSAVATINSLPDTSAYLATAGGTNTIKFKGQAGALTDGGAINTLTEEEIAVAAAKGWTCSFV